MEGVLCPVPSPRSQTAGALSSPSSRTEHLQLSFHAAAGPAQSLTLRTAQEEGTVCLLPNRKCWERQTCPWEHQGFVSKVVIKTEFSFVFYIHPENSPCLPDNHPWLPFDFPNSCKAAFLQLNADRDAHDEINGLL